MLWPSSNLTKTLLIKRFCGQTIITPDKNCSCDKKLSFSGCVKPSLSLREENRKPSQSPKILHFSFRERKMQSLSIISGGHG